MNHILTWNQRRWIPFIAVFAGIGFIAGLASLAEDSQSIFRGLCYVAMLLAAYLLPTIVATNRKHHNKGAIAVVNIFLGWTFIGWVVALAMASSALRPTQP